MKAILIFDEMPACCYDCPCCDNEMSYCTAIYGQPSCDNGYYFRLDNCPLKLVPDKVNLDDILKGE